MGLASYDKGQLCWALNELDDAKKQANLALWRYCDEREASLRVSYAKASAEVALAALSRVEKRLTPSHLPRDCRSHRGPLRQVRANQ